MKDFWISFFDWLFPEIAFGLQGVEDWEYNRMKHRDAIRRFFSYVGIDDILALILLILGLLFYVKGPVPYKENWHNFYSNIHSELIGIGVTVLILGNADEFIKIRVEKQRIIGQLGSPYHFFSVEAARQLKKNYKEKIKLVRGAILYKCNLHGINLDFFDFTGSKLCGSNLRDTSLVRTNFYKADLRDVNFSNADLQQTDMRKAILYGINFEDTYSMWKVKLSGAKYDLNTIWPEHIDPVAAGAILVDNSHFIKFYE